MPLARTLAFQAPVARSAVGSGATGLRVSSPDDVEEREADHIADKVMRSADLPRDPSTAVTEAPIVHRSPTGGQTQQPGPHVDSGAGHPLDRSTRSFFEPRFGTDLGHVHVHTDERAARAAERLSANAFAIGSDITFGAGQYAPDTTAGRRLLAHELSHVVRQPESPIVRRQPIQGGKSSIADPLPMAEDLGRYGARETQNLRTVRPGAGQEPQSSINIEATTNPKTGAKDLQYTFSGSARGQRGGIRSDTNLHLHYEPEDKDILVQPVHPELPIIDDPRLVTPYPVTISYTRTIDYSDEYGRTLRVKIDGAVNFSRKSWEAAKVTAADLTLESLSALQGSTGHIKVLIQGSGNLAELMSRDYPTMPAKFKDPIIADKQVSYFSFVRVDGNSLRLLCGDAAAALQKSQDNFPIHHANVFGLFVYLTDDAGLQYDHIRAYLESRDAVHVERRMKEIEESLKNPGMLVSGAPKQGGTAASSQKSAGPSQTSSGGTSWLDDVLSAIGDFWDSLPAPLRGTLKAIGIAVATVVAVIGIAALIVALSPVELTVAGVALAIGGALLVYSFFKAIYVRSMESYQTGSGNPLFVFFIAIGDAFGITAIIEGITNESVLSGQPLGLDEEEQWEKGVGGGLQLILTLLGLRSARRGKVAVTDEPVTRPPSSTEPPTVTPEPEPLFDTLTDAEVDAALGGAETPAVTGGRSRPRIGDRPVPKTQRRRLDVDDVPREPGETAAQALQRIYRVIGHSLDEFPRLRDAWRQARNQVEAERGPLTRDNYAELYDATRNEFWRNVRADNVARQAFENAGFEFPQNPTTAPVLRGAPQGVGVQESRISLDHILEKAIGDNWRLALDADNLRMEFQNPNSYREIVQARHPDLRPPPPPSD